MLNPFPLVSSALRKVGTYSEKVNTEFLRVTGAASLPPKAMVDALVDAYFTHVYHRCPVVDRRDLQVEPPSILLAQSLCLVGALLRHPKEASPLATSEEFYVKAKTLLHVNHEKDSIVTLKALCLIAFWNVTPPTVVSLDCSWHWLGVIIRQIYQMGLHQESTYHKIPNPGNARRIAWYAFVRLVSKWSE